MSDDNACRMATASRNPARSPTPRSQTNRRRVLRTILLTGGVLGAAGSGFLPLIYSQKQPFAPARRT